MKPILKNTQKNKGDEFPFDELAQKLKRGVSFAVHIKYILNSLHGTFCSTPLLINKGNKLS